MPWRRRQAGAPVDGLKLLDGLYFKTTDNDRHAACPSCALDGEIAAGAAVTALIITVGIEGGLHLTIGFHWNDPNNDGKFRVSEFLPGGGQQPALPLHHDRTAQSLPPALHHPGLLALQRLLLDHAGRHHAARLHARNRTATPPPPRLGGTEGDTLVVFAGHFGNDDARGEPWGNTADTEADVVKVTALRFAQKRASTRPAPTPTSTASRVQMLGETPGLPRRGPQAGSSSTAEGPRHAAHRELRRRRQEGLEPDVDDDAGRPVALRQGRRSSSARPARTRSRPAPATRGSTQARATTASSRRTLAGKVARVAGGPGRRRRSRPARATTSSPATVRCRSPTRAFTAALNPVDVENSKPKITTVSLDDVIDWTQLDVDPTGRPGQRRRRRHQRRARAQPGQRRPGDDKIGVASDRPRRHGRHDDRLRRATSSSAASAATPSPAAAAPTRSTPRPRAASASTRPARPTRSPPRPASRRSPTSSRPASGDDEV